MNRTLLEKGTALLLRHGITEAFWPFAIDTAAYLRNRMPTESLSEDKTPYEMWHGRRPYLGHVRVWGCLGFVHVRKPFRAHKFAARAVPMLLIGYDVRTKDAYRMWNPKTRRVIISRDVRFLEKRTWHRRLVPANWEATHRLGGPLQARPELVDDHAQRGDGLADLAHQSGVVMNPESDPIIAEKPETRDVEPDELEELGDLDQQGHVQAGGDESFDGPSGAGDVQMDGQPGAINPENDHVVDGMDAEPASGRPADPAAEPSDADMELMPIDEGEMALDRRAPPAPPPRRSGRERLIPRSLHEDHLFDVRAVQVGVANGPVVVRPCGDRKTGGGRMDAKRGGEGCRCRAVKSSRCMCNAGMTSDAPPDWSHLFTQQSRQRSAGKRRSRGHGGGLPDLFVNAFSVKAGPMADTVYEPKTCQEAREGPECEGWIEAMDKEHQAMHDLGVFEYVLREEADGRVIQAKWVFKQKPDRKKARLVAKGFQQRLRPDEETTQSIVALSSTESEYIAASDCTRELLYLMQVMEGLGFKVPPTVLYGDNDGCIQNIKNHQASKKTRHVAIRYHHVRSTYQDGKIRPEYVPSKENVADLLKKSLPASQHAKLTCMVTRGADGITLSSDGLMTEPERQKRKRQTSKSDSKKRRKVD
ncbi:unnamed protein product [Vitrella brassicaformis CCMP3155]|uniref:Retroviral polymerase SH3-like domain-containing protein n=1 Tax=Vitrella brassicaformis (strain CCMP3155) TaxID=1169540 RepID=A0A0G4GVX1_VITBC|nr:unnamed protein product [Vitrella brassicaformis CCMP3155]|eukprot:CEM34825.1 unnamed protein product [Vitrella brassicaformis CCMP3155]